MHQRAWFVTSPIYRNPGYGKGHPLSIRRTGMVEALCNELGWLPKAQWKESHPLDVETLAEFHDRDYLDALITAEQEQQVSQEVRERYKIGTFENPLFADCFTRPATACGGSVYGAELVRGGGIAFNPAGGTHHGRPNRASGFCYLNDPVFGILTFLKQGWQRVLYIDVDAHHGDGVEAAFENDPRVMTISIHEEKRWPHTGLLEDRGALGQARNLPLPRGFNDSEMAFVTDEALIPLLEAFAPDALVLQCGADALAADPLSKLSLSNNALWRTAQLLTRKVPRALVTGGGGYNPWTVIRCWTGVWAKLTDREIPTILDEEASRLLKTLDADLIDEDERPDYWLNTLRDKSHQGPIRQEIVERVKTLIP